MSIRCISSVRLGQFVPVTESSKIGGNLWRVSDEKKFYAVAGTKGYRWAEARVVEALADTDVIDLTYFESLADDAFRSIDYYGSFAALLGET
jgi:hypothetical protein